MATRREKLVESLAKEDRKADLKRIKKAQEYLVLAFTVLAKQFYDEDSEDVISPVRLAVSDCMRELKEVIGKK